MAISPVGRLPACLLFLGCGFLPLHLSSASPDRRLCGTTSFTAFTLISALPRSARSCMPFFLPKDPQSSLNGRVHPKSALATVIYEFGGRRTVTRPVRRTRLIGDFFFLLSSSCAESTPTFSLVSLLACAAAAWLVPVAAAVVPSVD